MKKRSFSVFLAIGLSLLLGTLLFQREAGTRPVEQVEQVTTSATGQLPEPAGNGPAKQVGFAVA